MANASEVVGAGLESRRLLRLAEVKRVTGLKKDAIYRSIREGGFPSPYRIGARMVAWRSDEIAEWLDQLERATIKNFV